MIPVKKVINLSRFGSSEDRSSREDDGPVESSKRIMYPRKHQSALQRNPVTGGVPITEELALDLRNTVFGSCIAPPRGEWLRTGFVFREPDQELAYGLKAPRNGTRGLLSVVQAFAIKNILFDKAETNDHVQLLKPSKNRQIEALWSALADIMWTVGEKKLTKMCLPHETPKLTHSSTYFADGVTEFFMEDPGPAALLLLYSAILTRETAKVRADLEDDKSYIITSAEEGSNNIITLLLTGRATPYLHNGVVYVGDEDHYAKPQWGIMNRSDVGFLLFEEGPDAKNMEESKQPGSRLKTPSLPIWVVNCTGHYAVLFNTNSELLRNYHAERRVHFLRNLVVEELPSLFKFDLFYYSVGGSHSLLSVDTRYNERNESRDEASSVSASSSPIEKLIHTKWADAHITWTGLIPFV